MSTRKFQGAPVDIGAEVFTSICMECVRAAQKNSATTPKQLAQLYVGFLTACMGSMAADFGKAQAESIAQTAIDSFKLIDLDGSAGTH